MGTRSRSMWRRVTATLSPPLLVAIIVGGAVAWAGVATLLEGRAFQRHARQVRATVISRHLGGGEAANFVLLVEYPSAGRGPRRGLVIVDQATWDATEPGAALPLFVFERGDGTTRLAYGEIPTERLKGLLLLAVALVMFTAMLILHRKTAAAWSSMS